MSRGSYQKQASLGIVGIALVASPLFFRLPGQFHVFNAVSESQSELSSETARIKASEDLERAKILQRKQTADVLKKSGMIPVGDKLKIRGYYDNHHRDPKPEVTGFLADDKVYIYDSAGVCIGRIENRQWKWKKYYPPICNNAPAL